MDSVYERAIEQVVADLKNEFASDLLGMLLGGSVAYGTPLKQSDVDMYAIIRPSWRQRRAFRMDGIEVELFINPVQQLRKEFKDTELPTTIAIFAQGRILYDPQGVMSELVAEAQRIWRQARPAVVPEQFAKLRYIPVDLLKDAQDMLDVDEVAATFVIDAALRAILDVYYKLERRWTVKPKYQLGDLHEHAPHVEQLVRRVVSCDYSARERCASLATLIDTVLEPIGGRLNECESEPEHLVE